MGNIGYKTPEEVKDFEVDWSADLGSDIISSSSWSVSPCGITLSNPVVGSADTTASITTAGGVADQVYLLTNSIITDAGRTLLTSLRIAVMSYGFNASR